VKNHPAHKPHLIAAIVIWRDLGMVKEGEQMASQFAVTFSQAAAMAVGGCQHHDRFNSRSSLR
jgi:hypothetical protein